MLTIPGVMRLGLVSLATGALVAGSFGGSVAGMTEAERASDINQRRRITRDFTTVLIDQLVRDLEVERDTGWRPPSMQRFRDTLVHSSGVIETRALLSGIYSSGALMSQASMPSEIQEAAMEIIVEISCHRYESTIREAEGVVIPDGPDRYEDFQPRPQMSGAVGGSFADFHSDEERAEYERNIQLLRRRTQYKGLKGVLERELEETGADIARLMRLVDFSCDDDGRAMLRRMLTEASTPEIDYVALAGLPGLDEPALPPWPVRE